MIDHLKNSEHAYFMAEALEERVRQHAPGNASGYYLELHDIDGKPIRYPEYGAFKLKPFIAPSGTPFGTYMLYFVRYLTDPMPMTPTNGAAPFIRIQIPQTKKLETESTDDDHKKVGQSDEQATETASEGVALDNRIAELDFAIASTPAMITARADFEKQRMAMELAENNQELLTKGNFSRDAAEALALNRAYRRESQVTIEAQAHLVRRTAEDVQSHWAAFRTAQDAQIHGMRLLKEQIELFAKPAPPPPPTDYTPAIVEGLKTLRDFGVAMIQAKTGVPAALPATPSAGLAQQSTTARLVADGPPDAPKPKEEAAKAEAVKADKTSENPESTASGTPADKESPPKESPPTEETQDAESEMAAVWKEIVEEWPHPGTDAPVIKPVIKPVKPITSPSVSRVASVLNPAQAKGSREEAARLWRALAETSEVEAMVAVMNPEQLEAFLRRLRQRVKR